MASLKNVPAGVYKKIFKIGGMKCGCQVVLQHGTDCNRFYYKRWEPFCLLLLPMRKISAAVYFALAIGQANPDSDGLLLGKGWIEYFPSGFRFISLRALLSRFRCQCLFICLRDSILPCLLLINRDLYLRDISDGSIIPKQDGCLTLFYLCFERQGGRLFPVHKIGILCMWVSVYVFPTFRHSLGLWGSLLAFGWRYKDEWVRYHYVGEMAFIVLG